MRAVLQAAAAAAATLLVPMAGTLSVLNEPTQQLPDGSWDDAPWRAAMVFLMLSPIALLALTALFACLATITRGMLPRLLAANLALSTLAATFFAIDGYLLFGLRDGMISFVMFGGSSFLGLSLGSIVWWLLRPKACEEASS